MFVRSEHTHTTQRREARHTTRRRTEQRGRADRAVAAAHLSVLSVSAPVVSNDSKMFRFCRSKCHRNFKAKRNPRKLKWTKAFRKAHGKELVVDKTFDFERLRHRPIKYDRELMGKTIQAMQRIAQIKAKREQRFWQERMKDNVKKQKAEALRDLAQNIELAKPVQESVTRKTQLVQARLTKTKNAVQRAAAKAAASSSSSSAAAADDIEIDDE